MQWLTGSLNGATWEAVLPLAVASVRARAGAARRRAATSTCCGSATTPPPRSASTCSRTRILADPGAPSPCSPSPRPRAGRSRSSRSWPGPIAARIVGPGASLLLPAGLVGALLVLVADLLGQFAFGTRYPVGVVTGVLGAPYLIYLLIRTNRSGGSL